MRGFIERRMSLRLGTSSLHANIASVLAVMSDFPSDERIAACSAENPKRRPC